MMKEEGVKKTEKGGDKERERRVRERVRRKEVGNGKRKGNIREDDLERRVDNEGRGLEIRKAGKKKKHRGKR